MMQRIAPASASSALKRGLLLGIYLISGVAFGVESVLVPYSEKSLKELLLGNFAYHQGRNVEALKYFRSQSEYLDHPYLAELSSQLALSLKDTEALHAVSSQWVLQQPDNVHALFYAALGKAFAGQPLKALSLMAEVRDLGGKTDYTWITRLLEEEVSPAVLSHYKAHLAFAMEPSDTGYDAMIALATLRVRTGETEGVTELLEKALIHGAHNPVVFALVADLFTRASLYEKAVATYEKGTVYHPYKLNLRVKLARLTEDKDPEIAKMQYEILKLHVPDSLFVKKQLALIYLKEENLLLAKPLLYALLKTEEADFARIQLALLFAESYESDKALSFLSAVDESGLTDALKTRLVKWLVEAGRTTEARKRIRHYLSVDGSESLVISLKLLEVDRLLMLGKSGKAMKQLENYRKQHPGVSGFVMKSAMIATDSLTGEALSGYLKGLLARDAAENTDLLVKLGQYIAIKNGHSYAVRQQLREVLSLSPGNPVLLDSYGWLLYRMGCLSEAKQWVTRAFNSAPTAENALHLGEILLKQGEMEQAKHLFNQAFKLSPHDKELSRAVDRLKLSFAPAATACEDKSTCIFDL